MYKSPFPQIDTPLSKQRDVFESMNKYFNCKDQQEYNIEKLNNEDIAFFLFYFNLYAKRNNKKMISFDYYNFEKGKELLKKISLFSSLTWSALISRESLNKVCLFISSYNYFLLDQYSGDFPKNEQEDKVLLNARIDMEFLRIIIDISQLESASEKVQMFNGSSEDENDNNKLNKNNSKEWKEILGEKVFDVIRMNSDTVKDYFKEIFKTEEYEKMLPQSFNLSLYEKALLFFSNALVKKITNDNKINCTNEFLLQKPLVINFELDEKETSCKVKSSIMNNLGSCKNGFNQSMDSFWKEINTVFNSK